MLVSSFQQIYSPKNAQALVVRIAFERQGRTARTNRCGYPGFGFDNGNGVYNHFSSGFMVGAHKVIDRNLPPIYRFTIYDSRFTIHDLRFTIY
jgi:hypothetical protein